MTVSTALLILAWLALGAAPAPDVQFTDITQAIGIDFTHENSATSGKYLVETMGGGVALLDYDNDGRLDVFFTNGAKIDDAMPAGRLPDKSDRRFWNRLYRQREDGTFLDVTEKAGLTGMPQNQYGMGVAAGDYDNDGFADLYVTSYGEQHALPQQRKRHVHRRHPARGRRRRRMERQRRLLRLRQRRQARSVRHPLSGVGVPEQPLLRGEEARLPRLLPSRQLQRDRQHPLSQQRRRHVRGRIDEGRHCRRQRQGARRRVRRLRPRRLHGCLRRQRLRAVVPLPQHGQGHVYRSRPAGGRRVQRGRQDVRRHGRGLRRLRQRRPPRPHRHGPLERTLPALSPERRRQLPGCRRTCPAWGAPRCRFRVGARGSSTTTTTAGRTSLSRRAT